MCAEERGGRGKKREEEGEEREGKTSVSHKKIEFKLQFGRSSTAREREGERAKEENSDREDSCKCRSISVEADVCV